MSRYHLAIWGLFVISLTACSIRSQMSAGPTHKTQRPNILLIVADDLGYGDLGCYGQKKIQTPFIDQLATEGLKFTQCYAGSPVCAPSRSVLMTGLHTGHTTVRGNNGIGGVVGLGGAGGRIPLLAEDLTVAEVLKSLGYTTGMVGKWGLGEPGTSGLPGLQGFDYFFGFLNQRRAHSYFPDFIWENEQKTDLPENKNEAKKTYIQDLFLEKTLGFLDQNKDSSFFLYLPYTLPHEVFEIPDLGKYADSLTWSDDEKTYASMVRRLDSDVGTILSHLDQLGLSDNTLVIFTSDNGAAFRWDGNFDSSGLLRGRKRDLYEGGIRVPMIVRLPGQVPENSQSHFPWYFADFLPTLASMAGKGLQLSCDGIDVSPHFFNPQMT